MRRFLASLVALCGLAAVTIHGGLGGAQGAGQAELPPKRAPQADLPPKQVEVQVEVPQRPAVDKGVALRSSSVVGSEVKNAEGEELGSIEDLVIDVSTGKVRYAALSFGGFLGVGDKLFAVPWGSLQFLSDADGNRHFVLDASQERLETAPGFDKNHWPDVADPKWAKEIDRYYGVPAETRPARSAQRRPTPN
jgi:sporulation protein YlmC with PRC-barrel domain